MFKLDHCNNFQAEFVALNHAIRYIRHEWEFMGDVQIISGSFSVLEALGNLKNSTDLLLDTWNMLSERGVKHFWTRAHVSTIGDEEADQLAKEAMPRDDSAIFRYGLLSVSAVKKAFTDKLDNDWQSN